MPAAMPASRPTVKAPANTGPTVLGGWILKEHAILFIYGAGGNGKSVFIKTLANILGEYHYKIKKELLASSAEGQNNFSAEYWLANLHRIRLATVSEIEGKWAEATLKDMTGGDIIAARHPGGEPFNFPPEFKPLISGNNAPTLEDRSPAMRRRVKIGPFDHAPEIPDLDLEEKLRAEYPAILAWMIEGAVEWFQNSLGSCRAVDVVTDAYFHGADLWGQWQAECCVLGPTEKATSATLLANYNAWRKANGARPINRIAFNEAVDRTPGLSRDKDKVAMWIEGINLKMHEPEEPTSRFKGDPDDAEPNY
jgi:putative DNA primase/helicase